ncbi:hypothetical protein [Actinophytocola sp.]|uniref:hypothetical protein n=1 Tax=Actinophytocola sp. TaxID=1872138 RepID=UPI00389ABF9B
MSEGAGAPVRVLDIRDDGPDLWLLDKLDKSTAHREGLTDRVVVIDRTESLMDNHIRYQRLVSLTHVRAVICVAVGPLARGGDIALRQSAAFAAAGVTLWVGDEWGSRWAGGSERPRPITPDGTPTLPDLIAVLSSPRVFDEVFTTVRQVPHQAVCPGLAVVHPSVSAEELRFLRTQALDDLVQHTTATTAWPPAPAAPRDGEPVDPVRDVIATDSPLGRSRRESGRAVKEVTAAAAELPRLGTMVFGGGRVDPTVVAAALDAHLDRVDELLAQLDRHATGQGGPDQLRKLGVPAADHSDNPTLAEVLRRSVLTGLGAGHSLRDLAVHLRGVANKTVSEGTAAARAEVASMRNGVPGATRAPTPPAVWPSPMAPVAATAALTGSAAAWLSSSFPVGVAVGLVWVVLTTLLLFRLPGLPPAGAARAGWVAVAMLLGLCGAAYVGTRLPWAVAPPTSVVVAGVGIALAAAVCATGLAWRHVTTGWLRGLRLADVRRLLTRATALVDDQVRDHVRTWEHRRRLADAALLLASGATELARLYTDRVTRDRAQGATAHGPVAAELLSVLHGDLVELTMRALADYLHAIGTDTPLTTDPARLADTARRDLTEYHAFLDAHSVHAQPPMITGTAPRESLSRVLWRRSDDGRRVLCGDGREELTQLCEAGDIRALNVSWHDTRVLRFAPAHAQRVLLATGAPLDVVTTDTDLVGMVRLVPLASGRVVHEHPVVTEPDDRMDDIRDRDS